MRTLFTSALLFASCAAFGQSNITVSNAQAEKVMLGQYNPAQYTLNGAEQDPHQIIRNVMQEISADSLKAKLEILVSFANRNSGSDTVSSNHGIGAVRRWIYEEMEGYGRRNGNRLLVSYLNFDQIICEAPKHRNVFAVLPGTDTSSRQLILIEAHMDSRCEEGCDVNCPAPGAEDNGSGTVLVMELARVLSRYNFKNTIVFMTTTAEEQSLAGATAFAEYAEEKNIPFEAILNNDVIGGIVCGKTSSPPSCPGLDAIDSTHVRIFSAGNFNSESKTLARYSKLEYQEEVKPHTTVPMNILIMAAEDREGRGGDHIPFRQRGFASIRFTAANEHGHAHPDETYTDRQHSTRDVLGEDLNGDGLLDTFNVSFTYLQRNAVINAATAITLASNIQTPPTIKAVAGRWGNNEFEIVGAGADEMFRLAYRPVAESEWEEVLTVKGPGPHMISPENASLLYAVSAARVDANGIEGLFGTEVTGKFSGFSEEANKAAGGLMLLPNKPNPFDEATILSVMMSEGMTAKKGEIIITDLQGKELKRLPLLLQPGLNEVLYTHGFHASGTFLYSLVIDGQVVQTKKMIFEN